jgi:hypothetical protein
MNELAGYQNEVFHFEHLLRSKPGVYPVYLTKHTPGLGKWNISTDKKKHYYTALTDWIQTLTTPNQSISSSSSTYAKNLQTAFTTDQSQNATPSKPPHPAWNRLPVLNTQYKNSTSEDFPPLKAKTNSDETRPMASSTRLTFNGDLIQKGIVESKFEWQAETKQFQGEIRASHIDASQKDLKTSIKK